MFRQKYHALCTNILRKLNKNILIEIISSWRKSSDVKLANKTIIGNQKQVISVRGDSAWFVKHISIFRTVLREESSAVLLLDVKLRVLNAVSRAIETEAGEEQVVRICRDAVGTCKIVVFVGLERYCADERLRESFVDATMSARGGRVCPIEVFSLDSDVLKTLCGLSS